MTKLSASEATEISNNAEFDVEQALKYIYSTIRKLAKVGFTHTSMPFSKQLLTAEEFRVIIDELESHGYTVTELDNPSSRNICIKWN